MKTALLAIGLLALAPPDLVTVLAEKQRRAIYDATDSGLESFVLEFTASEWKSTPLLANAKLVIEWPALKFAGEGLPRESEENPMDALVATWSKLGRVLLSLDQRVAMPGEGYKVSARAGDAYAEVTAILEEASDSRPSRITMQLDDRALLLGMTEEGAGGLRVFTDFGWKAAGERWVPTGCTLLAEGRKTVVRVEHAEVGGFTLPSSVSIRAGTDPERTYAFAYRSVNGKAPRPAAEGPFATPEATIRSFIDAAKRKDPGMLAKCFAENCEKEFQPIREQKLAPKDLDELAEMFGAARVKGCEMGGDGKSAVVTIVMKRGGDDSEEQIELAPDEYGEWQILRF